MVRNQKRNRDHPTILRDVVNTNHLECRICLSTYKYSINFHLLFPSLFLVAHKTCRLFYVEDTEDFFYRPPVSRPKTIPAKPRKINYEKLHITPPAPSTTSSTPSTAPSDDNAAKVSLLLAHSLTLAFIFELN